MLRIRHDMIRIVDMICIAGMQDRGVTQVEKIEVFYDFLIVFIFLLYLNQKTSTKY
jgi:hypothetical protein